MFSSTLDLGKTAFLTIKTAQTGNVSSGRLLSQDFCFFRLLTVRRRKTQTVGKYRFQQLVGECFCAAGIEKQLRNNGLPVPLCRDNSVRLSPVSYTHLDDAADINGGIPDDDACAAVYNALPHIEDTHDDIPCVRHNKNCLLYTSVPFGKGTRRLP